MKLLLLCLCVAVAYGGLAPLYLEKTRGIPNSFIIKIKDASLVDQVADEIQNLFVKMRSPTPKMTKTRLALPAVTLHIPPHLVNDIRSLNGVEYIEQDGLGELLSTGYRVNPTWGLDRIDQRDVVLDDRFYFDDTVQGNGVNVYIVDTGVQIDHSEFGGRAQVLYGGVDDHSHGTHCAGTAAGNIYGIASQANVFGVKSCNKNGGCPKSEFVAGCDAVQAHGKNSKGVVSMSLRFGSSLVVDEAVQKLWDNGFVVSIAAGNDNSDACPYSPQKLDDTITAGATNKKDERAYFSNYGSCVDIFAPGVSITSAGYSTTSIYETKVKSGTSMACPHVTGAAALYFGLHPGSTPQAVKDALLSAATKDVVIDPMGTPNRLLFVRY